jgi:multiple sugar transport system permease protein
MTAANTAANTTLLRAARSERRPGERRWAMWLAYACLFLFIIFFLFPPYYMLITSLKTNEEIAALTGNPFIIQREITFDHYINLFTNTAFPTYFLNTVIVTVLVVIITMATSILAAYSLSRLRFWGAGIFAMGIFLTYLVPETLLFIPLFKVVGGMGLLDTIWSLVVVYPTLSVPFCTWILIGYFSSIPKELDEAALIDGANYFQMLYKIFIPVAMPGIIAATIFCFTLSWGAFLYPMAFTYSDDQFVLTAGTVSTLIRGDVFHWGGLMAAALVACAPPVILYAFLMDYYISGLTTGATKS